MIMQCGNCGEMFDDAEESHDEVCPHSVHVAPERTDEVIFDPRDEGTERQRTNAGALLHQWN